MAIFNLNNYKDSDGTGFPLNFRRGNPNPLDNSTVWGSLEAAEQYATTNPIAYVGQILTVLTVVDEVATSAQAYIIQDAEGTLKPVGTEINFSEDTIVTNSNDELTIKGYDDAAEGAQLVKTADGLSWVVPSTTTIEGIQTAIEAIKTTIGDSNSGLVKQVNDNKAAIDVLNSNSTTTGSVAYQIAQIVAGADEDFDTLKEIADWIASDTTGTASMNSSIVQNASDIDALEALVGSTAVATQISNAINTALKTGGVDKYALASELATLSSSVTQNTSDIATLKGADTLKGSVAKTVKDAIDTALKTDGVDKYANATHTHTTSDITGLQEVLNAKATQSDLDETNDRISSLETDAHTHDNKSILDTITQGKVTNWDAAQENTIENIKVNGQNLTISDKTVTLPTATAQKLGLISPDGSSIVVNESGIASVNSLEVSKLYVADGNELILNGGTSII